MRNDARWHAICWGVIEFGSLLGNDEEHGWPQRARGRHSESSCLPKVVNREFNTRRRTVRFQSAETRDNDSPGFAGYVYALGCPSRTGGRSCRVT